MSIVSVAKEQLKGKTSYDQRKLIDEVCEKTGSSYESVRGTLIKRGGLLGKGWASDKGNLIRSESPEGYHVDYDDVEKRKNWGNVKRLLPSPIKEMVTLAGENGHCIEVLQPEKATSYDYEEYVLQQLLEKYPEVECYQGEIWLHDEPVQVFNADLMGYMCGSLYQNLKLCNDVGHEYIVLTLQKQVSGFRNSGKWVRWASNKFRDREDKNLAAIEHALTDYKLVKNMFYKRATKGSRSMRTCVLRRNK